MFGPWYSSDWGVLKIDINKFSDGSPAIGAPIPPQANIKCHPLENDSTSTPVIRGNYRAAARPSPSA